MQSDALAGGARPGRAVYFSGDSTLRIEFPQQGSLIDQLTKSRFPLPTTLPDDRDFSAYKRLALAVMSLAFHDAEKGGCTEEACVAARRFLSRDSSLLRLWCRWLSINPDRVLAEAESRGWWEMVD